MELYKSRSFNDFFQDTFTFLKENGKHFFKEYFIINGIFLLILAVIGYFFTKFYTDFIFSGVLKGDGSTVIDSYLNENLGVFLGMLFVFIVVGMVAGIVSYAFPAIYFNLYSKNGGANFETRDILDTYKRHIGKLTVYVLCSILISIPAMLVLVICTVILTVTIVGIFALPLLIGAFTLFYGMTLMEYLEGKKGIWESFSYAWTLLKSKFWPAVGSIGLFFLIIYIIQNIISIIPYFFGMASLFTSFGEGSPSDEDISSAMTMVMLVVFFLTFLVSSVLGTVVRVNEGLIFYTLKEENEHVNTKSVIDQIGSGE
ncbi:hypothetical protein ACFFU1_08900 [Algibacter miyuki]|uniref:Glycerophosphoryl diester phosphodiesterase membrane domain-containing protein n=1 Tax=Algibacter miyuki TaxID=1306933 RepID=A0ABV5GZU9_9FLAO|nr:hypothetical protein [Algibacter miyuki]MDN3666787.1 hypothetical protein [Algibacter miyuki]